MYTLEVIHTKIKILNPYRTRGMLKNRIVLGITDELD